jgi:hypothetical protein
MIFSFVPNVNAQSQIIYDTQVETNIVYPITKRGLERCANTTKFEAKSKTEETFGRNKTVRKGIKENDRRAPSRLSSLKKEGYAAHHDQDSHCHHGQYWYQHAGYANIGEPRYENRSSRTTVNT